MHLIHFAFLIYRIWYRKKICSKIIKYWLLLVKKCINPLDPLRLLKQLSLRTKIFNFLVCSIIIWVIILIARISKQEYLRDLENVWYIVLKFPDVAEVVMNFETYGKYLCSFLNILEIFRNAFKYWLQVTKLMSVC